MGQFTKDMLAALRSTVARLPGPSCNLARCVPALHLSTDRRQRGRPRKEQDLSENMVRSENFPPELVHFDVTDDDFPVRTLKPGSVKRSDVKTELIRGLSAEDQELVIEVENPPNHSNPLLAPNAAILSEAIMARRVNKVTKGGKREKFSVLLAVGDGHGLLGTGSAKGASFFDARKRAFRRACRNMRFVDRCEERTVWHEVEAKTQASKVIIMPAPSGHGVRANKTTGALCRMAGITDIMIKTHGSPNPWSIVAAMEKALEKMTSPEEMAMMRGMRVHDISHKSVM